VSNYADDKKSAVTGKWITESVRANFVHANIKFLMTDSNDLKEHRVATDFELRLNEDNTFLIQEKNGLIKNGTYKLKDDTLLLRIKNSPNNWLILKVDSLYQNQLILYAERMFFQSFLEGDSIEFATGENVKLRLKKK
jgi:hypothetical protein